MKQAFYSEEDKKAGRYTIEAEELMFDYNVRHHIATVVHGAQSAGFNDSEIKELIVSVMNEYL